MAARKKGLGRGLDVLIGDASTAAVLREEGSLRTLGLDQLQRGRYQPRRDIEPEALQELADSIKAQGLMQPISVRPVGAEKFEIIAGERRWRACQLAGISEIPVLIRDVSDESAMAMALIENIQREDLNVIDEAVALQRLQQEFSLTHEQIAMAVGKSRTTITNLLRLLQLTDDVQQHLRQGKLEMGHARALLGLPIEKQSGIAREVVAKGLSVRNCEALVRKMQAPASPEIIRKQNPDIARLEQRLAEMTGAPVELRSSAKGKGKLVFRFGSVDELQGILERFGLDQEA